MRLKFFHVPATGETGDELARFLASHKVLEVDRQFVASGASSFWAICVVYLHGETTGQAGKSKIDYKEVLAPTEFEVYNKLRNLRKNLSERDGVPAYAIFTNEQLAALVRQRVTSASGLEEIPGIGAGRGGKYGEPFLQVLREVVPQLEAPIHGETQPDRP